MHGCVDWRALDGWAADSRVDLSSPGVVDVRVEDNGVRSAKKVGVGRIAVVLDLDLNFDDEDEA